MFFVFMGISNDYDDLVISGKVCIVDTDFAKVKELVMAGDNACVLALNAVRSMANKDDYGLVLSSFCSGLLSYTSGFLLACGIEVESEHSFLALCARYPCLELDYATLVSIQLRSGSNLSFTEWKKVEFYLRMYMGMLREYSGEQRWR